VTRTYVDAGILIAYADSADQWHSAARDILADPNREFVVSPFVELEVLPHLERLSRPSVGPVRAFLEACDAISDLPAIVQAAYRILVRVNMGTADALHVGAAMVGACDEILTTEKPRTKKTIHQATRIVPVVYVMDAEVAE
jgi:predicted nucleic acid-binding protein